MWRRDFGRFLSAARHAGCEANDTNEPKEAGLIDETEVCMQ